MSLDGMWHGGGWGGGCMALSGDASEGRQMRGLDPFSLKVMGEMWGPGFWCNGKEENIFIMMQWNRHLIPVTRQTQLKTLPLRNHVDITSIDYVMLLVVWYALSCSPSRRGIILLSGSYTTVGPCIVELISVLYHTEYCMDLKIRKYCNFVHFSFIFSTAV